MFTSNPSKRFEAISAVLKLDGFSDFCAMPDNHTRLANYLNFVFDRVNESLSTTNLAESWIHRKFIGDGVIYIWSVDNYEPKDLGERVFLALHNLYRTYPSEIEDEEEELNVLRAPRKLRVGIAQGEISELLFDNEPEYVGFSISLAAKLQGYCRDIGFLLSSTVSLPDRLKDGYPLIKARTKGIKGMSALIEEIRFVPEDAAKMSRRELAKWFTFDPDQYNQYIETNKVNKSVKSKRPISNSSKSLINSVNLNSQVGDAVEPIAVIGAISAGLNIIDKFRSLALKVMGTSGGIPSVHAEAKAGGIEIQRNGNVVERIDASNIIMSAWDEKRYRTLEKKVRVNWDMFNDIDSELPMASPDEKARLKQKLEAIKSDLCGDFREMLALYEITLGTTLGDHYSLCSVCGVSS